MKFHRKANDMFNFYGELVLVTKEYSRRQSGLKKISKSLYDQELEDMSNDYRRSTRSQNKNKNYFWHKM